MVAAAGYPDGVKIKLLVFFTPEYKGAGTAIKQYLDAVGLQTTVDVADPGRFFGTIYNNPPGPDADLSLRITGRDTNYLMTYMRWFSTEPFTDLSYLGHYPGQAELDKQAQKMIKIKDQEAMTKKLMRNLMAAALTPPHHPLRTGVRPPAARRSVDGKTLEP